MNEELTTKPCLNCGAPMPPEANFCPKCGNKYATGLLSVKSMLGDFFAHILNFDFAIFPTLRDLFVPAKLTREYFRGRHRRYVPPLRIFFMTAVVLIAIVGIKINKEDIGEHLVEKTQKEVDNRQFSMHFDSSKELTLAYFQQGLAREVIDTLRMNIPELVGDIKEDSIDIGNNSVLDMNRKFMVSKVDFLKLKPNQIIEKYEVKGFWNKLIVKQGFKMSKNEANFVEFLIGQTLWAVIIIMPFLALILKILYIRKGYYFVEHLVFCFHTHAYTFLLISLFLLLEPWIPTWTIALVFGVIGIYLFFSFKLFYQQHWFKTALKFGIAFFLYLFLMIGVILIAFSLGVLLF